MHEEDSVQQCCLLTASLNRMCSGLHVGHFNRKTFMNTIICDDLVENLRAIDANPRYPNLEALYENREVRKKFGGM